MTHLSAFLCGSCAVITTNNKNLRSCRHKLDKNQTSAILFSLPSFGLSQFTIGIFLAKANIINKYLGGIDIPFVGDVFEVKVYQAAHVAFLPCVHSSRDRLCAPKFRIQPIFRTNQEYIFRWTILFRFSFYIKGQLL